MSGFLDKLKDVGKDALETFVEFDDDGQEKRPAERAAAVPQGAPAAGTPAAAAAPAGAAPPDPEFVQQLQAAVQASKKAAYAQFRALFGALSAVGDEGQRTQLALSAAQASHGIDAARVAEAIDDRLKILADEKAAFDAAVKAEVEHSVGGTEAEIAKARAEIARKQDEIKALDARVAELEKTVREARATLDASSARFAASYTAVEAELAAERARITPFLTPKPTA